MEHYQVAHDWDRDGALSCTVAEAVAAVADVDPTDLEPLHDAIDPDALDQLFDGPAGRDGDVRVTFSYEGYEVTVTASGEVTVRSAASDGLGDAVADEAAFEEALDDLLRAAASNGVDVEGGWARRNGAGSPDWGIEIYSVAPADESH